MFILGKNWLKYRKKKYYFHKYIFRKFEIVVCFPPLLYGVEKNTFLNFDSINKTTAWNLKLGTWNSWKRMHCNEEARRIMGKGTSRFRMRERRGRKKGRLRVWDTASASDLWSLPRSATFCECEHFKSVACNVVPCSISLIS